jgi:hypothetical protein
MVLNYLSHTGISNPNHYSENIKIKTVRSGKMKKCIARYWGLLVTILVLLVLVLPATPAQAVVSQVNLVMLPSAQTVSVGNALTITVQAQCGSLTTDGIDTYIDFDPTYLAVQSSTAGTTLSTVLLPPAYDNTAGTFGFSAGRLEPPFPGGTFTVVTIIFQAKNLKTDSTNITFHNANPRKTLVDSGGTDITGTLTGAAVTITIDAPLYLNPAAVNSIVVDHTFNMDIKTNVTSSQQVDELGAFVNFDPLKLEAVDADAVQPGIQITPGTSLNTVLTNTVDNTLGLISYRASKPGPPFPSGSFVVATIQFKAKAVTSPSTPVSISMSGLTTTSYVNFGGLALPGTHGNAAVQIIPGANVNLSVALQGGSRPDAGWVVPLTVKFFTPGISAPVDVLTATPVYTFSLTTAKSGSTAAAQATGLIPGTYDITVVSPHCLCNVKRDVVIATPSTAVDMGTLLEGNANDDNTISSQDFGILAVAYGKGVGEPGYEAGTDFDRSGRINIADFGLLASNYGKNAPVEIP